MTYRMLRYASVILLLEDSVEVHSQTENDSDIVQVGPILARITIRNRQG